MFFVYQRHANGYIGISDHIDSDTSLLLLSTDSYQDAVDRLISARTAHATLEQSPTDNVVLGYN